jgi:hypothetical protein
VDGRADVVEVGERAEMRIADPRCDFQGWLRYVRLAPTDEPGYRCDECEAFYPSTWDIDHGMFGDFGSFVEARGWDAMDPKLLSYEEIDWADELGWPDAFHAPPVDDVLRAATIAAARLAAGRDEGADTEHWLIATLKVAEEMAPDVAVSITSAEAAAVLERVRRGRPRRTTQTRTMNPSGTSVIVASRHRARDVKTAEDAVLALLAAIAEECTAGRAPATAKVLRRLGLRAEELVAGAPRRGWWARLFVR